MFRLEVVWKIDQNSVAAMMCLVWFQFNTIIEVSVRHLKEEIKRCAKYVTHF